MHMGSQWEYFSIVLLNNQFEDIVLYMTYIALMMTEIMCVT